MRLCLEVKLIYTKLLVPICINIQIYHQVMPTRIPSKKGFTGMRNNKATIAWLVALMFFVSFLVVSFHNHPDGKEHADCAVCAVKYHHSTGTSFSVVVFSLPVLYFPTLFLFIPFPLQPARHFFAVPNRAPPF